MDNKEKFEKMIEVDFSEEIGYSTIEVPGEETENLICADITLKNTPALRKFAAERAGCDEATLRGFTMSIDKGYFDIYDYRLYFYSGNQWMFIVLTREEQEALYDCVDQQFREKQGITCMELVDD